MRMSGKSVATGADVLASRFIVASFRLQNDAALRRADSGMRAREPSAIIRT